MGVPSLPGPASEPEREKGRKVPAGSTAAVPLPLFFFNWSKFSDGTTYFSRSNSSCSHIAENSLSGTTIFDSDALGTAIFSQIRFLDSLETVTEVRSVKARRNLSLDLFKGTFFFVRISSR